MGWATPIRAPEQVDYRLARDCGCDVEHDAQVEYRLAAPRDLRWIGSGLAELDLAAGEAVDADAARALMDGRDWRTGEQLVARKQVLDPRGKLAAHVLVDAVTALAEADGITAAEYLGEDPLAKRLARAERGIRRDGERHLLPLADVERLAAAAGLSVDELYGDQAVAEARKWMHHRVDVGLRGVDIVLDLPKSISTAWALAGDELAAAIEEEWMESVTEAVAALEQWTAYGMAGHHGDGEQAERIATSGFLGWTTLHRSARPVDGAVGDPHLHVHVNIAHMAKGADGKWRTIAAGAEDLLRHAHLTNEIAEARLRQKLTERHGARFERSETTGAWELAGIDEQLREAFSRRHHQVLAEAGEGATRDQQKAAARKTAEAKHESDQAAERTSWRDRAAATFAGGVEHLGEAERQAVLQRAGGAVDAMVTAALPGPDGPAAPTAGGRGPGPLLPGPRQIAEQIWDAEHGLVAARKVVGHTHVLSAVVQQLPYLDSVEQLTELTGQVLAVEGHAVQLRDSNRAHQVHRQRYTHASVIEAESTIITSATTGLGAGLAQLTREAAELTIATVEVAKSTTEREFRFSDQQRAVIERLLTAGHAADAVIGVAGAGKTTLMAAARTGWEAAGLRVVGASTAAVAAANLAAEAGIDSRTVAAWTRELNGGRGLDGVGVLVIDEAAMVDDRALAALLRHAAETGTKVVAVGDPLQLRAVGIGGGFARIHQLVDGLVLDENRRQVDAVERAALQTWREGGRTTALAMLAERGRVHACDTAEQAHQAMLAAWNSARADWAGDPHGQVEQLLLLAARRADVAELNAGARALREAAGELPGGHAFRTADGTLEFATGDLVHVRRNDYRSRRGDEPDVLNGYRGVALETDARRGVLVEWRRPDGAGGHVVQSAWMSPADVAEGRLTHGYAMTIGSAQGLTSEVTIASGHGADAHSLYPALSRARQETHLWLPLAELEDDTTRLTLGDPRSQTERLDRAVAAYGRQLERDGDDVMVTDELPGQRTPDQHGPEGPHEPGHRLAPPAPVPGGRAAPAGLQEDAERRAVALAEPEPPAIQRQARPQDNPWPVQVERIDALLEQHRDDQAAGHPRPTPQQEEEAALRQELARARAEIEQREAAERAARDAAAPHWRQRPYGPYTAGQLATQLQVSEHDGSHAVRFAAGLQQRADALAAVLGTDQAPAAQRAADMLGALAAAQHQAAQAEHHRQLADQLKARIAEMYEENHKILHVHSKVNERAGKWTSKVTFRSGGMREAAGHMRDLLDQRVQQIADLRSQENELRGRAADEARDAQRQHARSGIHDGESPAEFSRRITAALQLADRQDLELLRKQASQSLGTAAQHQATADQVRAEQQLRAGLSPERASTEQRERAAARQRTAQTRAARQEQLRQQHEQYHYRPPEPPSPSRGISR
ncbi:MobF family relaxase [Kitasatospora sp. HPMI-4]|uniref:MobF family relaxase n=1 Tax=Kitasatospora sp. HPMI-4 TaxID=3448443 RepID=UPI003F1AA0EB